MEGKRHINRHCQTKLKKLGSCAISALRPGGGKNTHSIATAVMLVQFQPGPPYSKSPKTQIGRVGIGT